MNADSQSLSDCFFVRAFPSAAPKPAITERKTTPNAPKLSWSERMFARSEPKRKLTAPKLQIAAPNQALLTSQP